eukprot:736525-Pyramimonas_sp.AAC.1
MKPGTLLAVREVSRRNPGFPPVPTSPRPSRLPRPFTLPLSAQVVQSQSSVGRRVVSLPPALNPVRFSTGLFPLLLLL